MCWHNYTQGCTQKYSRVRRSQKYLSECGVFKGQVCLSKSRDMLALGPFTAGSDFSITWQLSLSHCVLKEFSFWKEMYTWECSVILSTPIWVQPQVQLYKYKEYIVI